MNGESFCDYFVTVFTVVCANVTKTIVVECMIGTKSGGSMTLTQNSRDADLALLV
jgi:hypothetical protein